LTDMRHPQTLGLPVTVPQHLHAGLDRYVFERIETGGFLRAVLENDLYTAIHMVDPLTFRSLRGIVEGILLYLPEESYGSPEKVEAWLRLGYKGTELPTEIDGGRRPIRGR
jgi:hypothetical protein